MFHGFWFLTTEAKYWAGALSDLGADCTAGAEYLAFSSLKKSIYTV
jgi:hypothetical protein